MELTKKEDDPLTKSIEKVISDGGGFCRINKIQILMFSKLNLQALICDGAGSVGKTSVMSWLPLLHGL